MPIYETVLVFKPQLSDAEISGLVDKAKKLISGEGGEILNEDKWGRRKLAYQIRHCREGFYIYLKYQGPTALPARLDGQWRVQEPILRMLTVHHRERKAKPKKAKAPKKP